jgi:hypothetical protein
MLSPNPQFDNFFPTADDRQAWAAWWHALAEVVRQSADRDPDGPLYHVEYLGDHLIEITPNCTRRAPS